MIARIWRGAVRRPDGDVYAEYMHGTGIAGYARTPGNRGAWMLRRDVGDRTEFVMFTLWESLEAVKAFAGEEYETAVFYPEDERFLVERDLQATHFDVAGVNSADARPRLHGERVALRPLVTDDVAAVAEIQAEVGVARWWGLPDEDDLQRKADGNDHAVAFAIEAEGELAGLIEYHEDDEPDYRHAGIDLFLGERHRGRGLGPDALRTLARYLVHERGHHRLTIDPSAENEAAVRAFERAGFRRVGVMREYWRSPDGEWRDGLLLELLASELER
jgi:aminoglycoside 6'-N-acetyltransferase